MSYLDVTRRTDGLSKSSALVQGCPVFDRTLSIAACEQLSTELRAYRFWDMGDAAWRDATLVLCRTFAAYLQLGHN